MIREITEVKLWDISFQDISEQYSDTDYLIVTIGDLKRCLLMINNNFLNKFPGDASVANEYLCSTWGKPSRRVTRDRFIGLTYFKEDPILPYHRCKPIWCTEIPRIIKFLQHLKIQIQPKKIKVKVSILDVSKFIPKLKKLYSFSVEKLQDIDVSRISQECPEEDLLIVTCVDDSPIIFLADRFLDQVKDFNKEVGDQKLSPTWGYNYVKGNIVPNHRFIVWSDKIEQVCWQLETVVKMYSNSKLSVNVKIHTF